MPLRWTSSVMFALLHLILCATSVVAFPKLHAKRNVTWLGDVRERNVSAIRVLPLGDSITNGVGSSDGNGYRKLFFQLAEAGGLTQMIGSRTGRGEWSGYHHEGWNGYTINEISEKATNALKAKPNLVLLLAGTNNMNNASQAATAPTEIEQLLDKIFVSSSSTVLLIGSIPNSTWLGRQVFVDHYNAALATIVNQQARAGKRVILVPINGAVKTSELKDGLHPNDDGYEKMAVAWIQAANEAQDRGWFQEPEPGNGFVQPSSRGARPTSSRRCWWHIGIFTLPIVLSIVP